MKTTKNQQTKALIWWQDVIIKNNDSETIQSYVTDFLQLETKYTLLTQLEIAEIYVKILSL